MSREIKFRAWDSQLKLMSFCGLDCASVYQECLDDPLMQFIGVQDNNGVDIYEGDIVEYCIQVESRGPKKQTVISMQYGKNSPLHNYFAVDFTIIGNIHENPELLEKES